MGRLKTLKPRIAVLGIKDRTPWQESVTTPKRISGTTLQNLRKALFEQEPLCRECVRHDRVRAATIRDHIIPIAEGGTEDPSNIQPLCQTCSDEKTRQEASRGRWGGGSKVP
jgi:5-methylcytosine-specific restriction protein A